MCPRAECPRHLDAVPRLDNAPPPAAPPERAATPLIDVETVRVHFPVPVSREEMGLFGTTQASPAEVLGLHRAEPVSPHLEVETYTWDVLPPAQRTESVVSSIARELDWVTAGLLRASEPLQA